MAGVAGIFLRHRSETLSGWFRAAAEKLLDRGAAAWEVASGVGVLGQLAPRDAGRASTVARSGSGDVWLALDGEVFEIDGKRLDRPEAAQGKLVELYERHGGALAAHCNGSFTAAILDRRGPEPLAVLACDRLGTLPVFYLETAERLYFSSRLDKLVRASATPPRVHFDALADLLTLSYILGDDTLFEGVRSVPAGGTLICSRDGLELRVEDCFRPAASRERIDPGEHLERIRVRFEHSVAMQTASPRRVVIGLTGGRDSRAIAATTSRVRRETVTATHTVAGASDAILATQVADTCGLRHVWMHVDGTLLAGSAAALVELTGGLLGSFEPHPLACMARFREAGDVLVSGVGGEAARGFFYPPGPLNGSFATDEQVTEHLFKKVCSVFRDADEADRILRLPRDGRVHERARARIHDALGRQPGELDPYARLDRFYLQQRTRKFLLLKGARVLRTSFDIRNPFLDGPLLDLFWQAPMPLKRENRIHRYLIGSADPRLLHIPIASTGEPLDSVAAVRLARVAARKTRTVLRLLLRRPLRPYAPQPSYNYRGWLANDLGRSLATLLLDTRSQDRGIFEPREVRRLFIEHVSDRRDATQPIMALAAVEAALRLAEGEPPFASRPAETWSKLLS